MKIRRPQPRLDPEDLEHEQALQAKLEQVLDGDLDLRLRSDRIRARHGPLMRKVSQEVWKTFQKVEEAMAVRSSHALLTVLRWAFWEGYRAASRIMREQSGSS